eukprot:gene12361-biopygen3882
MCVHYVSDLRAPRSTSRPATAQPRARGFGLDALDGGCVASSTRPLEAAGMAIVITGMVAMISGGAGSVPEKRRRRKQAQPAVAPRPRRERSRRGQEGRSGRAGAGGGGVEAKVWATAGRAPIP